MRIAGMIVLCLTVTIAATAQQRPGDPYYDDAPPSPCGPINPDQPCYVSPPADYQCTGIGGCKSCERDPFAPNYYSCTFMENRDGACKCWPVGFGRCDTEGTCTYLRGGDPNP